MKLLKARYDLILFFFLPFTVIAFLTYLFAFDHLLQFGGVNWLLSIPILLFAFTAKANIPLGKTEHRGFDLKWLVALFSCQLLLNLTMWSFSKIIIFDLSTLNFSDQFNLTELSVNSGLFPWGFMILLTLTLGYFTYHKKQLGYLSSVFVPFFKNTHLDSIGIAVDSYVRLIPFFLMYLLFSLFGLSIILLLGNTFNFPVASGLNLQVCLISCALLLLATHHYTFKILHKLLFKNISIIFILLGFTLFLSLTYCVLSIILNSMSHLSSLLAMHFTFLNTAFDKEQALLLIIFCWIGLSLLIGAYIAFISQHKTMRQIIISSFFTYLLSLSIIYYLDKITNKSPPILLVSCLMLILSIIWIAIMLNRKCFTYFLRGALPTDEEIKIRSSYRLIKIVPMTTASFLTAYLAMNVHIWSFLTVLGLLPPFMIIFISYLAWSKEVFKDI